MSDSTRTVDGADYDVIVVDAYRQPYIPFFMASREFFELARDRLAPGGAVVVNVGAMGSHAMIVSRELGIPCVVSVADGTDIIPDGAIVTVDGNAGTVSIDAVPD